MRAKLNANDASAADDVNQLRKTYALIGLLNEDAQSFIDNYSAKNKAEEIPSEVVAIAEERFLARQNKDWATSDKLRDELLAKGYVVKDSKEGYTLTKK